MFKGQFNISQHVRAIETPGHTVGHSSLVFCQKNKNIIIAGDAIKTLNDYKNVREADVAPYNYKAFLSSKRYIKDNFDIIIPGHSGIITKNSQHKSGNLKVYKF
ncbi:MBL fold metallo-hydrolase [Candidatus Falkowbacteria bacterium]|nr:MBL fold metallo-hydrolase [Candidatus Falkowbacteria bacterium]